MTPFYTYVALAIFVLFLWGCRLRSNVEVPSSAKAAMHIFSVENPGAYHQVCQALKDQLPTSNMVEEVLGKLVLTDHEKTAAKIVVSTVVEEARQVAKTHPQFLKMIADLCE